MEREFHSTEDSLGRGGMPTCSGREDISGPGSMGRNRMVSGERKQEHCRAVAFHEGSRQTHPQSTLNLRMWVGGDGQG